VRYGRRQVLAEIAIEVAPHRVDVIATVPADDEGS
jgi:hypothetical protein